jgi:hypothetical protein
MITSSASTVAQYERLELTIDLPDVYDNPFDPAEVEVAAVFTTPSGKSIRLPGFYYQPYRRSQDEDGREALARSGGGSFKVRFAWSEVGAYRFEALVRDERGRRTAGTGAFEVTPSSAQGYVRPVPSTSSTRVARATSP